jgi:hypothetical protein
MKERRETSFHFVYIKQLTCHIEIDFVIFPVMRWKNWLKALEI